MNGPKATAGRPESGAGDASALVFSVMNRRIAIRSGSFMARSAYASSARSTSLIWPSLESSPGRIVGGSSTIRKRLLVRLEVLVSGNLDSHVHVLLHVLLHGPCDMHVLRTCYALTMQYACAMHVLYVCPCTYPAAFACSARARHIQSNMHA